MVKSAKDVSLEAQRPSRAAQGRKEASSRQGAENKKLSKRAKVSPIETETKRASRIEDETGAQSEIEEVRHGFYVYGIMRRIDDLSVARLPEKGIAPTYPVYVLPHRAIQAIVSKVSLVEFDQEALETNLQDTQWLAAKVYAHESIIEAVFAHCTLIPMRFCTIFRSESRVREMLGEHHDDFVNTLTRLEGKKEWGLKVFGDGAILAQRIGEVSDRVKRLEMEMAEKSGGAAYLWKKRLEEAIAGEIDRVGIECAQHGHDRLSSRAEESVTNPLQGKEITSRMEEMILNGAYLVADERLGAFQAELAGLEDEYGALGFSFQVSGPWPPYNFVASPYKEARK